MSSNTYINLADRPFSPFHDHAINLSLDVSTVLFIELDYPDKNDKYNRNNIKNNNYLYRLFEHIKIIINILSFNNYNQNITELILYENNSIINLEIDTTPNQDIRTNFITNVFDTLIKIIDNKKCKCHLYDDFDIYLQNLDLKQLNTDIKYVFFTNNDCIIKILRKFPNEMHLHENIIHAYNNSNKTTYSNSYITSFNIDEFAFNQFEYCEEKKESNEHINDTINNNDTITHEVSDNLFIRSRKLEHDIKHDRFESPPRLSKGNISERLHNLDSPEKLNRFDNVERTNKFHSPEKSNRFGNVERPYKFDSPEKLNRFDNVERVHKFDSPEKNGRFDKIDRQMKYSKKIDDDDKCNITTNITTQQYNNMFEKNICPSFNIRTQNGNCKDKHCKMNHICIRCFTQSPSSESFCQDCYSDNNRKYCKYGITCIWRNSCHNTHSIRDIWYFNNYPKMSLGESYTAICVNRIKAGNKYDGKCQNYICSGFAHKLNEITCSYCGDVGNHLNQECPAKYFECNVIPQITKSIYLKNIFQYDPENSKSTFQLKSTKQFTENCRKEFVTKYCKIIGK